MNSSQRLDEIRRRVDATIRGPWQWFGNRTTHQVYLGTRHSGRLILLDSHTSTRESVYDHDVCESYTLPEARDVIRDLCGAHDVSEATPARSDDPLCRCSELRQFLSGELSPEEGRRDFLGPDGYAQFTRHIRVDPDLRFQKRDENGEHRTLMVSWKDIARYEVLDGLTEAENAKLEQPHELYREDIVGIDNPEAELIAHSREDMDFLLDRIDRIVGWAEGYDAECEAAIKGILGE